MTHEQETAHAHDSQSSRSSHDRDAAVPGQRSRAEQLVGPHPPTPSGIVQRKRDGNGVADNADAAVASATTSSGAPLPSGLMRKFESSLGADLSAVRVHTGGTSADAAQAVGARAYTLGNDIHFGAGQYDPSSSSGEHLLAHEVAHTVQQSGGLGRRAQFKLEVSSPGDSHEHEADRAADAMVEGTSFGLSSANGLARRVMRDASSTNPMDVAPKGVYDSDYNTVGVAANPLDQYAAPPTDWSQSPAFVAPGDPGAMSGSIGAPIYQPMKLKAASGDFLEVVTPAQQKDAQAAVAAFQLSYGDLAASWELMRPEVKGFYEASKDVAGTGLLGKIEGAKFDPGAPGADLSTLTGQQAVGTTTIDALFKKDSQQGATGELAFKTSAKGNASTKKMFQEKVLFQEGVVKTRARAYATAVLATRGTLMGKQKAVLLAKIIQEQGDATAAEQEVKKLQTQKAKAAEEIETTVKGYNMMWSFFMALTEMEENPAAGGLEILKLTTESIGTKLRAASDAKYEHQIETANTQVEAIIADLRAKQGAYIVLDTNEAEIAHQVAMENVKTALDDFKHALHDLQDIYDSYAEACGAAAAKSGGAAEGAKVEAAIKAVPKAELCLSKISTARGMMRVPEYTRDSGRGFNAYGGTKSGDAATFYKNVGAMKGYIATFTREEKVWTARVASLQGIANQFGV
jgi:Domain of unknown function (DUF4157)